MGFTYYSNPRIPNNTFVHNSPSKYGLITSKVISKIKQYYWKKEMTNYE